MPPQTAQQWEIGAKAALAQDRFSASLAWFDLTKQNVAAPDANPINALAGVQTATGEVRNRGLELDLAGEPWPGVRLIASYAYIDSRISKDRGLDLSDPEHPRITPGNTGHRLYGVPKHGGSLWLTYEPDIPAVGGLKLGGGLVARGQRQGDNANSYQLPGYLTVNLLAAQSWNIGPSRLTLQLNVYNLLGKTYWNSYSDSDTVLAGPPRSFLGSLRVEF